MRKESGFTLMELLTAVAIIAILCAIATPYIVGWLPNYRVGTAARQVLSAVERTRLEAVRQNAVATIQFNLGDVGFTTSVGGGPFGDGTLPAGISISSITFTGDMLQFNGQGAPSENGTVTVRNDQGKTRNITVSFGGNARIQ